MERKSESATIANHLSEDVLRQIFSLLVDIDLIATSLVCKLFCSLSSPLLRGLHLQLKTNSSSTYSDLQRRFKRFPGVKRIYISCSKLDDALIAISYSGLNLEKLFICNGMNAYQYPEPRTMEIMSTSKVIKNIKCLYLHDGFNGNPGQQQQQQHIEFINMFPSLIEFDFTYIWDDEGVQKVTSKFPNLRKISIGDGKIVTDKTLDTLSSNCPKLESVNFQGNNWFTDPEALYTFFCNNPQLSSVDMPDFCSPSISKVVECMQVLQNLNHLSLESDFVQDAVLIALAESRPPLKSLRLRGSGNEYTMAGLIPLLSACTGLEKLNVHLPVPHCENSNTHDAEMSIVVKRLPKLKHIKQ